MLQATALPESMFLFFTKDTFRIVDYSLGSNAVVVAVTLNLFLIWCSAWSLKLSVP